MKLFLRRLLWFRRRNRIVKNLLAQVNEGRVSGQYQKNIISRLERVIRF